MILHEIRKQQILSEPFSEDALKLARAIYNTYVENKDDNLYLEIKIKNIIKLLKLDDCDEAIPYIIDLFEELNEPLLVRDFKFYAKVYPVKFIYFCTYQITEKTIDLELNEEFLLMEKEYIKEKFLTN